MQFSSIKDNTKHAREVLSITDKTKHTRAVLFKHYRQN